MNLSNAFEFERRENKSRPVAVLEERAHGAQKEDKQVSSGQLQTCGQSLCLELATHPLSTRAVMDTGSV